jgi:hypothetical protein
LRGGRVKKGVPRGGGGCGGSSPDRRATLRPAAARGYGRAARPAREQGRPWSLTCGAPATVMGGGVNPVLTPLESIQIQMLQNNSNISKI